MKLKTKRKTLVSFRIDDVTFCKEEKEILNNALKLAREFKITFDLAVVAEKFKNYSDPEVFNIYLRNKDIFEIISHGLTHKNPINPEIKGEFNGYLKKMPIPKGIQEEHIKKMRNIFYRKKIYSALKILALPWHAGDKNTIKISSKYKFKLITLIPFKSKKYEIKKGKIIVSKCLVQGIPLKEKLTKSEIKRATNQFKNLISKNQRFIQIYLHLPNFYKKNNTKELINEILKNSNKQINFGFISSRFGKVF